MIVQRSRPKACVYRVFLPTRPRFPRYRAWRSPRGSSAKWPSSPPPPKASASPSPSASAGKAPPSSSPPGNRSNPTPLWLILWELVDDPSLYSLWICFSVDRRKTLMRRRRSSERKGLTCWGLSAMFPTRLRGRIWLTKLLRCLSLFYVELACELWFFFLIVLVPLWNLF